MATHKANPNIKYGYNLFLLLINLKQNRATNIINDTIIPKILISDE